MNYRDNLASFFTTVRSIVAHPKDFVGHFLEFGQQGLRDKVLRNYGIRDGLPTIDVLDLVPDLEETIAPFSFLEGGSPAIDLAVLKALAKRYAECRYFEIGTWRGESVANVASVAKECISLSFSDQEMQQRG